MELLKEMIAEQVNTAAETSFRLRVEQYLAETRAWRREMERHLADARAHIHCGAFMEGVSALMSAEASMDALPESEDGSWWMRRLEALTRLLECAQRVGGADRRAEVVSEYMELGA